VTDATHLSVSDDRSGSRFRRREDTKVVKGINVGILTVRSLVGTSPTLVGTCLTLLGLSRGIRRKVGGRVGLRVDADIGKEEGKGEHGGKHQEGREKDKEREKKETKPAKTGRWGQGIMIQTVFGSPVWTGPARC
jgi:hypothetical protein